jgi:hypothetical protein
MRLFLLVAVAAPAIAFGAPSARAITYDLNIDHCTGTCGLTDYGDVTVTDVTGGVHIDVQLQNGAKFNYNGGGGLNTFSFNFSQTVTAADITNVSLTGFTFVAPSSNQDGFGDFLYALNNSSGGASAANALLSFDVAGVTLADLTKSDAPGTANDVFFAADIFGTNGLTGLVGALNECTNCAPTPPGDTPIPGALPLFSSGMGLLGFLGWRRKRRLAKQAA